MVNTGKPSKGCYMCRARRIKCDEGKPQCMRCVKSKRVCPGYRDAFELKLRDESKSTKKKLNRRLNRTADDDHGHTHLPSPESMSSHSRSSSLTSLATLSDSRDRHRGSGSSTHHHNPIIARHMSTPIQQQAACFFLSNFVLVPESGTMRGYLDFILPLMKQKNPQTALVHAFSAVTLAALGTRPNSKDLASTADLWYLKALKEINSALKDPALASTEATLASVMLMASFEQLTPSRMRVGGWSSHIDGAVAMIKSCPMSRWSHGVARDLFIAVRAHMTLQCIANSRPVDTEIDWLAVEAYDSIVQSFAAMNIRMTALRAENDTTTTLKEHSADNVEKVLKLLRRAEALDKDYVEWMESLPSNWAIKTVAWMDGDVPNLTDSIIHPGRVDTYGELWMAYHYNIVRSCRLFTWTTILRCVAWLGDPRDYRLTPEYTTASRICQQLVEDIVSSVPYFFGWNRDKDGAMADKSNFACGATDYTAVRPLAGIFVMWPLFAAASSDFASPSQRVFLRGRLKYVAEMMGINQALIMFQAQLVHPSLYIARERMSLRPTTCHSSDTQVKIVSGVPSATVIVPVSSTITDSIVWTAAPTTGQQTWLSRATSPPILPSGALQPDWNFAMSIPAPTQPADKTNPSVATVQASTSRTLAPEWNDAISTSPKGQDHHLRTSPDPTYSPSLPSPPQESVWKSTSPPIDQVWSADGSTSPCDQPWNTTSPPQDQLWSATTSSPLHDQMWHPATPPQDQIWNTSINSSPQDLWKSSSPPNTQDHQWTFPITTTDEPWKTITTQAQLDNCNQVYSLPTSFPQQEPWLETTTAAPSSSVHDPSQLWTEGFENPTQNWIPRTCADQMDLYSQAHDHATGVFNAQWTNGHNRNKDSGVTS